MITRIGITGHRNLQDPEEVRNALKLTLEYFKERARPGELLAISSLAIGADTIFAEEALALNIAVEVILPFDLSVYKKDLKGNEKAVLNKLTHNKHPRVINPIPANIEEKNEAFLKTGKLIRDEADILVAVWNLKPANGIGGTADIVQYSRTTDKELHIINNSLLEEFKATDKDTEKSKQVFNRYWMAGIGCGLGAAIALSLGVVIDKKYHDLKFLLGITEIILLVISYPLLVKLAARQKKIQLYKRRTAEFFRTLKTYTDTRIPVLNKVEKEQLTDPGKATEDETHAINHSSFLQEADFENAKRTLYCLATGQVSYHHLRTEIFNKRHKRYNRILTSITIVFFAAVIVHFYVEFITGKDNKSHTMELIEHGSLFFSLFLPALYAFFEGIKYFNNWRWYIKSSGEMISELDGIAAKIIKCTFKEEQAEKVLSKLAHELRECLNKENINWAEKIEESEIELKP